MSENNGHPIIEPIPAGNPFQFGVTGANYSGQGAFRFWCQTVLPIVYDDSLSYYELLNKVVDYLNKTISDISAVETQMVDLVGTDGQGGAFKDLQTELYQQTSIIRARVNALIAWFNNLDVQDEINNKLDEMALDGTLTAIVGASSAIPPAVSAWLAEHLTPTTPPVDNTLSTSGAAADAKVTGDYLFNSIANIGNVYYNSVSNYQIGGAGYSATSLANALMYSYIPLNPSKNKITIIPKREITGILRVSIFDDKSLTQSHLLDHFAYGTSTTDYTMNKPIEISYDATAQTKYMVVSITDNVNASLSTTADRDLLMFIYNDNIIEEIFDDKIIKSLDDTLTQDTKATPANMTGNALKNGGLPYFDSVSNYELGGAGYNTTARANALMYKSIALDASKNKITIIPKREITGRLRISIFDDKSTRQANLLDHIAYGTATTDYTINMPIEISYDATSQTKYMVVSITDNVNNSLSASTDRDLLMFIYDGAVNETTIKNYTNNLINECEIIDNTLIGASGSVNSSTSYHVYALDVEPYTDYELSIVPNETQGGIFRVHGYYSDGTNETWNEQIAYQAGTSFAGVLSFNVGSANVLKISIAKAIRVISLYKKTSNLISGSNKFQLTPINSYVLKGAKVSILGASISTFNGYNPQDYPAYYPTETIPTNGVKNVNDTYWMKFINIIGGSLLVNNGFSGRRCSLGSGVSAQLAHAACMDSECKNLHTTEVVEGETITTNPDIIIVQVGGNDFTTGVTLGDYSGLTALPEDDSALGSEAVNTKIFANAYAIMLDKITSTYPKAKIICGTIPPIKGGSGNISTTFPPTRSDNVTLTAFNEKIRELARAFGCYVAEFYGNGRTNYNISNYCQDGSQHPNKNGMSLMCNALLNTLGQMNLNYFNV